MGKTCSLSLFAFLLNIFMPLIISIIRFKRSKRTLIQIRLLSPDWCFKCLSSMSFGRFRGIICAYIITCKLERMLKKIVFPILFALLEVFLLLQKYMPRKTGEEMNFTNVECLLYTFHNLAHKAPNATNSLCGYKIVTGQPSDRLGEDFSDYYKDFTERLSCVEDLARATMKKLTQGMAEHNKAMATAKTYEAKACINTSTGLRTCNNILAMTQPLHTKSPSFIVDKRINLSWKEAVAPSRASSATKAGGKRLSGAANGSSNNTLKRGRGGGGQQNQPVNRAVGGLSYGGRSDTRGRSIVRSRGRGWGARGMGRGFR